MVWHRQPETKQVAEHFERSMKRPPDQPLCGQGKVGLAEGDQGVHQVGDDPLLRQCHDNVRQKDHLLITTIFVRNEI